MTQYSDPSNEISNYPNPSCGFNPTARHSYPKLGKLGEIRHGSQGVKWVYARADEAIASGTCTLNTTTFLLTDAAGSYTAEAAFLDNEYGWVRQTAVDLA